MTNVKRIFKVKGNPFFPVGGQSSTSSAYNDSESEPAFKAVELLHGNTLLTDVYWEQVEPEEGKFDFTSVDNLLSSARRHQIKLILLWFATWKNANMDYAPAWVKIDTKRFKRVISPNGKDIWDLSPHCPANLNADKKAFVAFCQYLRAKDSKEQTVIGIQIENEPGILGSDRDYGTEAQSVFDSPVPPRLLTAMKAAGKGEVYDIWQRAGGKKSGTWPEVFGSSAGEFLTAWSIANYIDSVAQAGKAVYEIPMYMNVWMMAHALWSLPGVSYPAGGAVTKVLDLYKWFTPHLDLIAPDIKSLDSRSYEEMCVAYSRDDNPFFLPETPATVSLFRAIADYNLIGYHRMGGLETIIADDGMVRPDSRTGMDTIRCVAAVTPLLLKYQGTGKIHAVVQEENVQQQFLDKLDGYIGQIQFGSGGQRPRASKDWRHTSVDLYSQTSVMVAREQADNNRGRGLIIQASRHEFYLVGVNYRLFLRPLSASAQTQTKPAHNELEPGRQVGVDEGHFDHEGEFVVDRRRNGDNISSGLWVEPDIGVLRVITCD
jgi:hypothetical protein